MSVSRIDEGFSKLRSWMFPIYAHELRKLVPMGLLMMLISFNFWILHISKDTLVITARHSGAEVINFLKLPVFLFSLFFVIGYTWISNQFKQRTIFYGIIVFFLLFFLAFIYILYPHQENLNIFSSSEIVQLKAQYPSFKWVFPVVGYWGYSLFYIISELWGAVVLSLLFWQFANRITTVEQSRRFYMFFGMFNGLGTIMAGAFVCYYNRIWTKPHSYMEKLHNLILIFSVISLLIIFLYYYIHQRTENKKTKVRRKMDESAEKIKLSFVESFRYILSSKYVGCIALISISYNICINFVEVTWKSQIGKLYPDPLAMEQYFSVVTIYMGFLTFFIGFLGAGFVRRFSWKVSALITPIVMIVMTILFFGSALNMEKLLHVTAYLSMTPLMLTVWIGQLHNLFSKSCKFSFFAATKEMAFIPLDAELKVKGKAAVDVLSGRIGKFGASIIQSLLLSLTTLGTQVSIGAYLVILSSLIFGIWIWSIKSLDKQFLKVAYGSPAAKD